MYRLSIDGTSPEPLRIVLVLWWLRVLVCLAFKRRSGVRRLINSLYIHVFCISLIMSYKQTKMQSEKLRIGGTYNSIGKIKREHIPCGLGV